MAKKQYLSPELEINTLCCEDVLTASTEIDKVNYVFESFSEKWFTTNN
jgi:hypothetical protein